MGKKIVIINGHPNKQSFNFALAKAYLDGATSAGADIRQINICDLNFSIDMMGYKEKKELDPDLKNAQDTILWAEHLVWIHPVWWGGFPAMMKGFIDRTFTPGFAFKYKENSIFWFKLLTGKTSRIITTLDQPSWYYRLFYRSPSVSQLKKTILEFCGITPVKVTYIGIIKTADAAKREQWIKKVGKMGKLMK